MAIATFVDEGSPAVKRYEYVTGNLELMVRMQAGEPMQVLVEDIRQKWQVGNESWWDDYEIEPLIDSDEKRHYMVNNLLYSRITLFRALRAVGHDCAGQDPLKFAHVVPEVYHELGRDFPPVLRVIERQYGENSLRH